ncbi:primase-helicase family protein [Aliarcobacter butzleri]|uniref:primase-helicase family protein n=1 Tax=Aliarcobacter butzleri TaxID=28197 RepID=UPI002B24CB10|nr:primase-helicase family protein [Aliarcobacter butzleri]
MNFDDIKEEIKIKAHLKKEELNKIDNDIITKMIDFSKYEFNNWLIKNDNRTLNQIFSNGGGIWLNCNGEICYRFKEDGTVVTQPHNKANIVFTNYLNREIKLIKGTNEHQADIKANDLMMISSDKFNPHKLEEFYQENHLHYRNTFKPTKYLQIEADEYQEPKAIFALIKHLLNDNEEYYQYFVNWLAYFYQGLKKSQVSIVLRGSQGAGKGIFYNEVIKKIFGSDYCIQVNDKTLNTNFLGGIVEGRLFFNLDEISHSAVGNKNIKNFLKALVTNDSITAEKKHQNLESETKIFGQILITSNEPYIIEVETSDRRFSIFSTGDNLNKIDYLGFKNYDNFSEKIKKELKDFCKYLKSYKVDKSLANKALDTAEKKALINSTNDKFKLFANAIKNKDINFFRELEEEKEYLYNTLVSDFSKDRINKEKLTNYFNDLFEEEIKSKTLNSRLKAIEPILFDDKNITKSNGNRYYKI